MVRKIGEKSMKVKIIYKGSNVQVDDGECYIDREDE